MIQIIPNFTRLRCNITTILLFQKNNIDWKYIYLLICNKNTSNIKNNWQIYTDNFNCWNSQARLCINTPAKQCAVQSRYQQGQHLFALSQCRNQALLFYQKSQNLTYYSSNQQLFSFESTNKNSTTIKMATTTVRQNFHQESEAGINKQINLELYASYVYLSMVSEKKNLFVLKSRFCC